MADPGWTDITSTNVVAGTLLKALGYKQAVNTLSVPIVFQALSSGQLDVFLGNWMPDAIQALTGGLLSLIQLSNRSMASSSAETSGLSWPARNLDQPFSVMRSAVSQDRRSHRALAAVRARTVTYGISAFNLTPTGRPFGVRTRSGLGGENGCAAVEHSVHLNSVRVALGDVKPY